MIWIILISSILGIILLILILSLIVYLIAFYNPKNPNVEDNVLDGKQYIPYREKMLNILDNAKKLGPYENVETKSFDNLILRGKFYFVDDNEPIYLMVHGYKGTGLRDFAGGLAYCLSINKNVLLIDQRGHGKSDGHTICFGIKERYDVISWINYLNGRFKNKDIYLYGISMGASTVLMSSNLNLPKNVKAIVADCPYSSPKEIIEKVCKKDMKIPLVLARPFIYIASRLYAHFSLDECNVIDCVKEAKIPIYIVHGGDDLYVPKEMSERIKDANSKLVTRREIPHAPHGISFIVDYDKYIEELEKFIESIK